MKHGRPFHPQSQGAIEKLNYFVGQSLKIAYNSYLDNRKEQERFDIEYALKAYISIHNSNVHSITKMKPNELIVTKDERVISDVNNKIKSHYSWKNSRINKRTLKIGSKVYIIANENFKVDENNELDVEEKQRKKKGFEKKETKKCTKIAAEVVDISDIEINKVKINICGGKLIKGIKLEQVYLIKTSHLAIAKVSQWNSFIKNK